MVSPKEGRKVQLVRVPQDKAGQRLDNFIAAQLPGLPRSAVYRVIRKGQVRINGGRARPDTRLATGDEVRVPPAYVDDRSPAQVPEWGLALINASIYVRHDDFLVINKPSGIAVHGGSNIQWGVIDALRQLYPDENIELVHRLDRETSGCLLIARNATALSLLRGQFRSRTTGKRYLCLTNGRLVEERVAVDVPLSKFEKSGERFMEVAADGKQAVTDFRLLEHYGQYSFVEATPLTGRTHQIRVHAAHLGLPLAGDSKYSSKAQQKFWHKQGLSRLFLHAHSLSFEYPEGHDQQFNVPLPDDLRAVLDAIR